MAQKWRQQNYTKQRRNNETIANFQAQLSHELWESVFDEKDVTKSFNLLLNLFLRIFFIIVSLYLGLKTSGKIICGSHQE
jgi:hypothetical protein